jgi:hypothetical protein
MNTRFGSLTLLVFAVVLDTAAENAIAAEVMDVFFRNSRRDREFAILTYLPRFLFQLNVSGLLLQHSNAAIDSIEYFFVLVMQLCYSIG